MNNNFDLNCFHCGDSCPDDTIVKDEKYFCCTGCLFVHELIHDNKLDSFYALSEKSGIKPREVRKGEFDFLDDPSVRDKLLQFSSGGKAKVALYLPEVYCSACVWLLERLGRLDKGLLETRVNFLRKEISILYDENLTSLKNIVELLTRLGYKPALNLADAEEPKRPATDKTLIIRLGIAGFCFGNIMLLAFPEYLSSVKLDKDFAWFIGVLNVLLSLPLIYSAWGYFKSAWNSLKIKRINLDVPLSIGILALFVRSYFEIATGSGAGYTDSLAGLLFFLLIGKFFQQKTYHRISFSRDYRSYFPLSALKIEDGKEIFIPLKQIKKGCRLLIRNNEIIPCDSKLLSKTALIDYSFVTGESNPVEISEGEKIYAGGRITAGSAEAEALKPFNQSYLTGLWNNEAFMKEKEAHISKLSDLAAKYFTVFTIIISLASFFAWLPSGFTPAMDVFTAILIVACPCAIALSIPFAMGTMLRIFGRYGFFLKNDKVVEHLARADSIVFDKTGTLTSVKSSAIFFNGSALSDFEKSLIRSATKKSTHPLSRQINNYLNAADEVNIEYYSEEPGEGIEAQFEGNRIKIGSKAFAQSNSFIYNAFPFSEDVKVAGESAVYISINGDDKGYFDIKRNYRDNIRGLMRSFFGKYKLSIVSGDNDSDKDFLESVTEGNAELLFNKLPEQKLEYIKELQKDHNKTVIMVGDGLNDAGALRKSNIGVAVVEDSANFSPGSDAILLASSLEKLPLFLKLSKSAVRIVILSYTISILYNVIGLAFAVSGKLQPLLAAILMPASSISVMAFAVGAVYLSARLKGLKGGEFPETI